jgi:hypothetical protein
LDRAIFGPTSVFGEFEEFFSRPEYPYWNAIKRSWYSVLSHAEMTAKTGPWLLRHRKAPPARSGTRWSTWLGVPRPALKIFDLGEIAS